MYVILLEHDNYAPLTCSLGMYSYISVFYMYIFLQIYCLLTNEGQNRRIRVACDLNTTNHFVLHSNATISATPYTSLYIHILSFFQGEYVSCLI